MVKEEKAVAILMANLKGSKNKPTDILTFAEACNELLHNEKWGIKEMSDYFKTSEYQIRQISKIDELDLKLKKLVSNYDLGIEAAYQLWRIQNSKERGLSDAIEVAKLFRDMQTEEVRAFVHFFLKNTDLTIAQCKELSDKERPEKIRILALPMDEETFEKVERLAKKEKLKLHDFVLQKILRVIKHA